MTRQELQTLKARCDRILDSVLGDIDRSRDYEAMINGFNKAWDVVRDIFEDEIRKIS